MKHNPQFNAYIYPCASLAYREQEDKLRCLEKERKI